jgi:hypothetical protein
VTKSRRAKVTLGLLGAFLVGGAVLTDWLIRISHGQAVPSSALVTELAARTASIPVGDRAWPVYRETLYAVREQRTDEMHYEPSDREHWPEYAAWLRTQRAAVDALIAASRRPALGLPWGSADMWMPHVAVDENERLHFAGAQSGRVGRPLRDVVRMLRSAAHIALEDGDVERAITAFDAACRVCVQASSGDASLLMQLSATAGLSATLDLLERLLADPRTHRSAELHRIAESLDRIERVSSIRFGQELPFALADLDALYAPEGWGGGRLTSDAVDAARRIADMHRMLGISDANADEELNAATIWIQLRAPSREEARGILERATAVLDAASDRTTEGRRKVRERLPPPFPYESAVAVLETIRGVSERQLISHDSLGMRIDSLRLAVELVAHRERASAWPDHLQPPSSLRVPNDRIGGQPLRWLITDDRLVIYSVGPDGRDDGGAPIEPAPEESDANSHWSVYLAPYDGVPPMGDVVIVTIELGATR